MKILSIFGTRPEIIKMGLLCQKLDDNFEHRIFFTGQHNSLAGNLLQIFRIVPHYTYMRVHSDLNYYMGRLMCEINEAIQEFKPDLILVQGDTASAFAGCICGVQSGVKVGHIEAGLRSWDLKSPFPEEGYRNTIDYFSDYLFTATHYNSETLLQEKENKKVFGKIFQTGNTIIDAIDHMFVEPEPEQKKTVLITLHRRENKGEVMKGICEAINEIAAKYPLSIEIITHPSSIEELESYIVPQLNISILPPENDYKKFLQKLHTSWLIMSDSGGIQEEVTYLGKPLLILRNTTERPEGLHNESKEGNSILAGTEKQGILNHFESVYSDRNLYKKLAQKRTIFGDGKATERIINYLKQI